MSVMNTSVLRKFSQESYDKLIYKHHIRSKNLKEF
jgi:hypothetical protein